MTPDLPKPPAGPELGAVTGWTNASIDDLENRVIDIMKRIHPTGEARRKLLRDVRVFFHRERFRSNDQAHGTAGGEN